MFMCHICGLDGFIESFDNCLGGGRYCTLDLKFPSERNGGVMLREVLN